MPVGHYLVTEQQNNSTLRLQLKNTMIIRLPENPTTGYSWNMTISGGLTMEKDVYIPSDTEGQIVGSGGTHEWNITAVARGEQTIRAIYKRPWEQDTGNETRFNITIVVE